MVLGQLRLLPSRTLEFPDMERSDETLRCVTLGLHRECTNVNKETDLKKFFIYAKNQFQVQQKEKLTINTINVYFS